VSGAVRSVSEDDFDEIVLQSPIPVLVDFWATWCGPCRMVAPVVEQLAAAHADRLRVVKLDVDEAPVLAQRYGVSSVPFLQVFEGGEAVTSIVGARPRPVLEQELAQYLH
jgi:thioredoxin 1